MFDFQIISIKIHQNNNFEDNLNKAILDNSITSYDTGVACDLYPLCGVDSRLQKFVVPIESIVLLIRDEEWFMNPLMF